MRKKAKEVESTIEQENTSVTRNRHDNKHQSVKTKLESENSRMRCDIKYKA